MSKVKIIAEIGCNHNGNIDLAKEMLIRVKTAGADYAKFQLYKTEKLVSPSAEMAEYQKKNVQSDSQYQMLKSLELTQDDYKELIAFAGNLGIQIFATPFDLDSVKFLTECGQSIWKIPSGEITNLPLLEAIAEIDCNNKEIVLSTGMSTVEEIEAAVDILGRSRNTTFTVLQCNTQYPTKDTDMNLCVLDTFKGLFPNWNIGLSDHSEGIVGVILAVGMGVTFIEKHFTLDKKMAGPDHKASIEPNELKEMCDAIRRAEKMLGTAEKVVTESEKENRNVARKSIVAACSIKKGEIFSVDNLTCKRPGSGLSPMKWHDVIGLIADRDYEENEMINCNL